MMWVDSKNIVPKEWVAAITTIQMKHPPKNYAATPS